MSTTNPVTWLQFALGCVGTAITVLAFTVSSYVSLKVENARDQTRIEILERQVQDIKLDAKEQRKENNDQYKEIIKRLGDIDKKLENKQDKK